MIGENQVSAIAEVQTAGDVHARFGERLNFGDQRGRIDNDASTNNGVLLGSKYAAWDELQNEAVFANDDRVPSVVAARYASGVIEAAGEIVDHFALTLIAPLRADDYYGFHYGLSPRQTRTLPSKSCAREISGGIWARKPK